MKSFYINFSIFNAQYRMYSAFNPLRHELFITIKISTLLLIRNFWLANFEFGIQISKEY